MREHVLHSQVMHALSRTGGALARLPASPEVPRVNAGLTFAVPRALGARADAGLAAERLEELAPAYARMFADADNPVRTAAATLKRSGL